MKLEQQVCSRELAKKLKELEKYYTWVDIKGYEGIYQISHAGTVRSLARSNGYGSRRETRDVNITHKKGYEVLTLSKNGKAKMFFVHRLVADAFIIKPEGKVEVNHKDGNKLNNYWWNLEWVTKSENQVHARKLGLQGGSRTNTAKLTEDKVREIRRLYPRLNSRQLAEKYGVGQSTICKIINYQYWKYVMP